MAALPTGTLTLLFSDIEGSTALLHRLGEQWGSALSAQRSIMRAAFGAHDGIEMGTEGDSFFVVFTSARDALLAAITAQRNLQGHDWPDGVDLRVRMGIHTGEPQRHEDGYIGEDVHRAARIGSTAHGAQIVVSEATERLLPVLPDITLRDLGHHRLKDLAGDNRLFDAVIPGLADEFAPLRSLGRVAALPRWTTPLVGRDGDVARVRDLVSDGVTRLVTLTGPGGTGKTRLGVAAANVLDPTYSDGVYFVGLSAALDAASMWQVIAEALDVGGSTDVDRAWLVLDRLRDRRALLVLDNVEQIADADTVVSAVLSGAPGVDVLACSRRPLLLVGEREVPVSPLGLPDSTDRDAVLRSGAVTMFEQHARLVRPAFGVTDDNSAAVAELCRRLDGLPLAIELAAAQVRLLSPAALLARIDGRLGSAFGATDRPARQRTLDAAIAWSYDLLAEPERALFRRLGVFEGDVDLEAIAAVTAGDAVDSPVAAVTELVAASLVRVVEGLDHEPRIAMLNTIRTFARDRLAASDEHVELCTRHLSWCADAVERTVPLLGGSMHTVALDRLDAIGDDIRAALRFALEPARDAERLDTGHRLLIAVTTRYWYRFGSADEAQQWQERALAALAAEGDERDSEQGIGLLFGLGVSMLVQSDLPAAVTRLAQALEMSRRLGRRDWQARILNGLAVARRQDGRFGESMALLNESLHIAREDGNNDIESKALGNLAVLHHDLGDHEQAARCAEQSLKINITRGDSWAIVIDQVNYTAAILHTRGAAAAGERLAQWLPATADFGETELMIDVLELAGSIAAGLGAPTTAATLLAAADERRAVMAMPRTPAEAGRVDTWVAIARQTMTAEDWRAACAAGSDVPTARLADLADLADLVGSVRSPVSTVESAPDHPQS